MKIVLLAICLVGVLLIEGCNLFQKSPRISPRAPVHINENFDEERGQKLICKDLKDLEDFEENDYLWRYCDFYENFWWERNDKEWVEDVEEFTGSKSL